MKVPGNESSTYGYHGVFAASAGLIYFGFIIIISFCLLSVSDDVILHLCDRKLVAWSMVSLEKSTGQRFSTLDNSETASLRMYI